MSGRKVGLQFLLGQEVALRAGRASLMVSFEDAEVPRTILLEPAFQDALADLVAARSGQSVDWEELRGLLAARGVDVGAVLGRP